jgi:hypothetical protein
LKKEPSMLLTAGQIGRRGFCLAADELEGFMSG